VQQLGYPVEAADHNQVEGCHIVHTVDRILVLADYTDRTDPEVASLAAVEPAVVGVLVLAVAAKEAFVAVADLAGMVSVVAGVASAVPVEAYPLAAAPSPSAAARAELAAEMEASVEQAAPAEAAEEAVEPVTGLGQTQTVQPMRSRTIFESLGFERMLGGSPSLASALPVANHQAADKIEISDPVPSAVALDRRAALVSALGCVDPVVAAPLHETADPDT